MVSCSATALAFLSAAWSAVYTAVLGARAVEGAPSPGGVPFFPDGWVPVVPAAVATAVCLLMGMSTTRAPAPRVRWPLIVLGWAAGVSMIAYCLLFWIDLTMLVMLPFGVDAGDHLAGLPLRGAGVVAGALTLWCTRTELRRVRSACERCGRVHGRSPERRTAPSPWWAYTGAYLAIAGLVARLAPALVYRPTFDGPGGTGFRVFVGLMLLAGTVLPLALAHRWGRVWPGWTPWAGRAVPRWLVLGPGVFMGAGLCAYFGVGGISAMAVGATPAGPVTVLEIGGYTVWGVGLLVASASYQRLTRPECRGAPIPVA